MYLRMSVFLLCVIKYRIRMNKEQEEVLGIFICYAYPFQTISFDISSRLNV
jgi:hypothetical protein